MGPLGWQETVFIFVLALLIFGPRKLPELGKTIGKAMTEFRRASSELKSTWDREMASVERETESLKDVTATYDRQIAGSYEDGYNSSYYDSNYEYGYDSGASSPDSSDSSTVGASATQGAEQTAQSAETASPEAATATEVASQDATAELAGGPDPVRT
ncbi:MAG: twin-arginine translocase TatA/TatE family subunit [Acidimicrobiia bacterium]|nr:twin-arginine translocase TatA/TatE family subunit [Acidimicrobiia bacterium]